MLGGIFWSRPTSHLYHEVWDVLQRSDLGGGAPSAPLAGHASRLWRRGAEARLWSKYASRRSRQTRQHLPAGRWHADGRGFSTSPPSSARFSGDRRHACGPASRRIIRASSGGLQPRHRPRLPCHRNTARGERFRRPPLRGRPCRSGWPCSARSASAWRMRTRRGSSIVTLLQPDKHLPAGRWHADGRGFSTSHPAQPGSVGDRGL